MHIIKWSDDFALGITEIDEQHRELVGMINALDASSHGDYRPETTRQLLTQLGDYVRDHFALEERLMAGGGCTPELVTRHCGEHTYFRSVLKDLTSDFENGRRSITVPLIEYLVHWLLHHIAVVDRMMANQLNSSAPEFAARIASAMLQDVTDDLTESERHLLAELRRANEELEQLVHERTQVLSDENRKLEADVRAMSSIIEQFSKAVAAPEQRGAPAVRTALILLAHGAPDPDAAATMHRVALAVRALAPEMQIGQAFLDGMAPGLAASVDALLAEDIQRIVVLPVFISPGTQHTQAVSLPLDEIRARYPQIRFDLAAAAGEAENVVAAIAAYALALTGQS